MLMATLPPYHNRAEKEAIFTNCVFCDSETDVLDWLKDIDSGKFDGSGISFRGMTRSSYKLFTSLQRQWILRDLSGSIADHHAPVTELLQEAWRQNEVRGFLSTEDHIGEGPDDLGMLSYLQHYGCPTPVLDFTSNIRVALCFAVEEPKQAGSVPELDKYFSVYIFHPQIVDAVNSGLSKAWQDHSPGQVEEAARWFRSYEMTALQDTLIFKPEWVEEMLAPRVVHLATSERFERQAGLFVLNNTADQPFPEALYAFVDSRTMDGAERRSVRTWVTSLNINRAHAVLVRRWLNAQDPPITQEYLLPVGKTHAWVPELFAEVLKRAFEGRLG